jgi:hypothetical protein
MNENSTLANKESKLPAYYFPKTVEVVIGMDHGQGALRGFAKIHLAGLPRFFSRGQSCDKRRTA